MINNNTKNNLTNKNYTSLALAVKDKKKKDKKRNVRWYQETPFNKKKHLLHELE